MWGQGLEKGDVPAAEIFASQVTNALEKARLYTEVQQLAITDELTGVYNRRGLFELGRREVERALRFGHPLSAVMIDIDHFKNVNDTYGHSVGDQVLKVLSERLQANLRGIEIIGRYGGEEFVILLLENNQTGGAHVVAARLLQQIVEEPIPSDKGPISITVSIGVAAVNQETKDLAALIERADRALYLAKRSGRNRVSILS